MYDITGWRFQVKPEHAIVILVLLTYKRCSVRLYFHLLGGVLLFTLFVFVFA